MVFLFLIFLGTDIMFSIVATLIYNQSHQQCTRVPFSSHNHQHLLFTNFLMIHWFIDGGHSDMSELLSHCGFDCIFLITCVFTFFSWVCEPRNTMLEKYLFISSAQNTLAFWYSLQILRYKLKQSLMRCFGFFVNKDEWMCNKTPTHNPVIISLAISLCSYSNKSLVPCS